MKRLLVSLLLLGSAWVRAQTEAPEEMVVTGHLPGPAMFRVSKDDDHVLWVFATIYPVPKDMIWESARVENVIAQAEEYLVPPDVDLSVSPLVKFNPINYVRAIGLVKRMSKNPDGRSLQDVLSQEQYQRLLSLREKYGVDDKLQEDIRPLVAMQGLQDAAFDQNGLGSGDFRKKINRLVKKNRKIKRTETEITQDIKGGYGKLADRVEVLMTSIPQDQEIACMDRQMARLEHDIPAMISRANSWAQGYADEFRDVPPQNDASNPCFNIILLSSEKELATDLMNRSYEAWLDAAENALNNNAITFAALDMESATSETGLLARLRARGYEVRAPWD